jgi:hypothetical protein
VSRRPAFADVADLADWLGDEIQDADAGRATRCLQAASNLIRVQTGRDWLDDAGGLAHPLPEELQDVCLACAGRIYVNPNAETQWSLQADDGMDGGSRKVEESGLYLTATEKATLSKLMAKQSPTVAGLGVIGTERGETASEDMGPQWFDAGTFLSARLTG